MTCRYLVTPALAVVLTLAFVVPPPGTAQEGAPQLLGALTTGANEPIGFRTITQRTFSQPDEGGWRSWEGNGGRFEIVSDAGASHGSTVGRMTFPSGMRSTKPGETIYTDASARELYVRFRMKVSSNWRGHASGVNKVFYFTDGSTGGAGDPATFILNGSGTGALRPEIRLQNAQLSPSALNYPQNVGNRPLQRGQWHEVEIILRYNTAGNRSDGHAHVWIDGLKVIQYNDIRWAPSGNLAFDAVKWEPYWGGANDTLDRTQHMFMDFIYSSGR